MPRHPRRIHCILAPADPCKKEDEDYSKYEVSLMWVKATDILLRAQTRRKLREESASQLEATNDLSLS